MDNIGTSGLPLLVAVVFGNLHTISPIYELDLGVIVPSTT